MEDCNAKSGKEKLGRIITHYGFGNRSEAGVMDI